MEELIKNIMSDILGLKQEDINSLTSMKTVSKWDSLKHMELIVAIEQNFDISQLSMEEIVTMTNYDNILEILKQKKL